MSERVAKASSKLAAIMMIQVHNNAWFGCRVNGLDKYKLKKN
jgi:hypothetical protein